MVTTEPWVQTVVVITVELMDDRVVIMELVIMEALVVHHQGQAQQALMVELVAVAVVEPHKLTLEEHQVVLVEQDQ
tara:strand:+ start:240 stop:467 length:228 start_codon:yes stop_codon:yes gene_type:complete